MKKDPNKKGTGVLEIIITSALIAIGLVGILSLATRSQKTTDFSRDNNLATNYSYQVADWLRDLRTTLGWDTFTYYLTEDSANPVVYCLNSTLPTEELTFAALVNGSCLPSSVIQDTVFSREVSIDLSNLASDYLTGTITTTWEGNKTYTNILEVRLSKWE